MWLNEYDSLPRKRGGALRQLPTSNTTENGSFYALLAPYGIATGINSGSVTGTGTDGKSYNIAEAPLYFVRSGYVAIGNGRLMYSGIYGFGWSSRSNSSDIYYAYGLGFNASSVHPSNGINRWYGFSLRCLARQ